MRHHPPPVRRTGQEGSDVREGSDRQSRGNRAADSPRLPRNGDQDGRRPFDRRRRRDACPARRRDRLHRAAGRARQLSERGGDPLRGDDHRRRRDPSRARLSRGRRRFRRRGRGARFHVYRSVGRAHPADGQQGGGQGCRPQARDSDGSGLAGRRARSRSGRSRSLCDRLSDPDQGCCRRRRPRHEDRS